MDRRTFLASLAALAAAGALSPVRAAGARPFSRASLVETARALASSPFSMRAESAPDVTARILYDDHGAIRPDPAAAMHAGSAFEVTPFHMARLFPRPVRLNVVEGGLAREVRYDRRAFVLPEGSPAHDMPDGAGFAGFRVHEGDATTGDWLAFLGASYFRSSGDLSQYGLSARGIAVDTGGPGLEEFPEFVEFWLEEGTDGSGPTVHALMDGPSVSGAYTFRTRRAPETLVDVEATVFARADIAKLGVAPLTSMFWYSESERTRTWDWRPEVHDSDGLQMATGSGEHLWRPLRNPHALAFTVLADEGPRGFGLMQRDRDPSHYEDRVLFERRPSLWIEPMGDWGRGAVHLVEIPTRVEFEDNVVAFWSPERPVRAGDRIDVAYRMRWCADHWSGGPLARCVATRLDARRPAGEGHVQRFHVDFEGPALDVPGEVVADGWASHGEFEAFDVSPTPDGRAGARRVSFGLRFSRGAPDAVELRLSLSRLGARASETWLYQLRPGEAS